MVWTVTGPLFNFSDTWQLVINTGTTIVTFLMVFLIQNTQNRDSEALQLKLDELIRATRTTHNALLDIEELSESELDKLKGSYAQLAAHAREEVRTGKSDLGSPEVKQGWKKISLFSPDCSLQPARRLRVQNTRECLKHDELLKPIVAMAGLAQATLEGAIIVVVDARTN